MRKVVFQETGYVHDRIPFKVYNELLTCLNLNDINSKLFFNHNLAGNIERSLDVTGLIPTSFYNFLALLANNYYGEFNLERKTLDKKFEFIKTWVNYQKKYEFNPLHVHEGSLSYVVWIKIPYDVDEELSNPNSINSNAPSNSLFSFVDNNTVHALHVDKDMEGEIIMFKSSLAHQVYPFYTSDEYRISLAGNLHTHWVDK